MDIKEKCSFDFDKFLDAIDSQNEIIYKCRCWRCVELRAEMPKLPER